MKKLVLALIMAAFAAGSVMAGGMPTEPTGLEKALTPTELYFKAVNASNVAGAKAQLDAKAVTIDTQNGEGNTGLHIAVAKTDLSMVLALVLYKPSTTVKNNKGQTIMDVAVATGNQQIIMALKQAGF